MKLTLHHLAPYLPYGVKVWFENHKAVGIDSISMEKITMKLDESGDWRTYEIGSDRAKPILRNLSDLTKEIEHGGERFVPIEKLITERDCDAEFDFIAALEDDWASADDKIRFAPYSIMQKLLEWHIDVFGLIKNKCAIDINSIK